jgi:hypothetical protein
MMPDVDATLSYASNIDLTIQHTSCLRKQREVELSDMGLMDLKKYFVD